MKHGLSRIAGGAMIAAMLVSGSAFAQLPTEELGGTEKLDAPDAHRAYLLNLSFTNFMIGKILVVDPDEQKFLGMVNTGFLAPAALAHDKRTLYTADTFYSRGTQGERTDVLSAYDTQTLDKRFEVVIPPKRSNTLTEKYGLGISDDDRFAYVYNFTPAASVTVVDLKNREVASEIDIAGCALNYPIGKRAFGSICGDGTMLQTRIDDSGQKVSSQRVRFFDPNKAPVNERAVRNGDTYYFVTLDGRIQPVDVSGDKPVAGERWSLFTDAQTDDGYGVGGWQLMAISPALNRLYVLVQPNYSDGHKYNNRKWEDPSDTIWAYDLDSHEKVAELKAPTPMISLRATSDDEPLLFGGNIQGGLEIFDLEKSEHKSTMDDLGEMPALMFSH